MDGARQFRGVELLQHLPRFRLEVKIASEHYERGPRRQTKIELLKQRHTRGSIAFRADES